MSAPHSSILFIVGLQFGDEAKGKMAQVINKHQTNKYDDTICVKANGSSNAGHTVYKNHNGKIVKHVGHLIPSGVLNGETSVIGRGVAIRPEDLQREYLEIKNKFDISMADILYIDRYAVITTPVELMLEKRAEDLADKDKKIRTTGKGVGPSYANKCLRVAVVVQDLFDGTFTRKYNYLKEFYADMIRAYLESNTTSFDADEAKFLESVKFMQETFSNDYVVDSCDMLCDRYFNKNVLVVVEGSQSIPLGLNSTSYPFVTSSFTGPAALLEYTGLPLDAPKEVIGVCKCYMTRVGNGGHRTLLDESNPTEKPIAEHIRGLGNEFGSTTGRPRGIGWLDLLQLRDSLNSCGKTSIFMSKLDIFCNFPWKIRVLIDVRKSWMIPAHSSIALTKENATYELVYAEFDSWDDSLKTATTYAELPENARKFIEYIEECLEMPIKYISNGAEENKLIVRN